MPNILVVELELVRGLEGDPVHKELPIFVNDLAVEKPGDYLVDEHLVELLKHNGQHIPHPHIAHLVSLVDKVHHAASPPVIVQNRVYQQDQLRK